MAKNSIDLEKLNAAVNALNEAPLSSELAKSALIVRALIASSGVQNRSHPSVGPSLGSKIGTVMASIPSENVIKELEKAVEELPAEYQQPVFQCYSDYQKMQRDWPATSLRRAFPYLPCSTSHSFDRWVTP